MFHGAGNVNTEVHHVVLDFLIDPVLFLQPRLEKDVAFLQENHRSGRSWGQTKKSEE